MPRRNPLCKVTLTRKQWRLVMQALQAKAQTDAGHSQFPNLFQAEETEEWELFRYIQHAIYQQEPT